MFHAQTRRDFLKTGAALAALGVAPRALGKQGGFDADFAKLPSRYWASPELWANPWEDWKVEDGCLLNLQSERLAKRVGRFRHVQCLTHEILSGAGSVELSLECTLREIQPAAESASTGFFVGIRHFDPREEYRSRLLFGQGEYIGFATNGDLFVTKEHRKNISGLAKALEQKPPVALRVRIESKGSGGGCTVTASVRLGSGKKLGELQVNDVPASKLAGNVGIAGNCPPAWSHAHAGGLWAYSRWRMEGTKLGHYPERTFGPILWTQYTVANRVLKLTAQMIPIGDGDERRVELQFEKGGVWETVGQAEIIPLSWTAPFRVENYDPDEDRDFRVRWVQRYTDGSEKEVFWHGTVRREPVDKPVLDVALFTCFMDYLFPNRCVSENVERANPDVLLFTGDQLYEPVGGWGIRRTGDLHEMCVNYLRKLALWGWSFRGLMKDRPTVTMPDDHDVYHGNLWGDSGRKITLEEWKSTAPPPSHGQVVGNLGGYVQPAEFVKAVERTQTSHLPDPASAKPLKQGITSYYTAMTYGRVGFAIIEDRKFKSGPLAVAQHAGPRPDHITEFGMAVEVDVAEAKLLGDDQLAFLDAWVHDWSGHVVKLAVSQTLFCGAATHHGEYDGYLLADMDSNGWPQQGRRRAVDRFRRGGVFMLGGDQHIPTIIRHGLDNPGDAGVSFCTPAGCTGYQRWWRPEHVGMRHLAGGRHDDREHTGCYRDGFTNIIDVLAVGNPPKSFAEAKSVEERGFLKSAGWTWMRIDVEEGQVSGEAWRVKPGVDVRNPRAGDRFPGWPMSFAKDEAYGVANPTLPTVTLAEAFRPTGGFWPVVRVTKPDGTLVSSGRMVGRRFTPVVFESGTYAVEVVDEAGATLKRFEDVEPGDGELRC